MYEVSANIMVSGSGLFDEGNFVDNLGFDFGDFVVELCSLAVDLSAPFYLFAHCKLLIDFIIRF